MNFLKLQLDNKSLIEQWFRSNDSCMSVNDFVTLYAWDINNELVYDIYDSVLTVRNTWHKGVHVYFCPVRPDDRPMRPYIERIAEYEDGASFAVMNIPSHVAEELKSLPCGEVIDDRDNYDYLYATSDLVHLRGKRYHSKRNFLHRFMNGYRHEFRDYTDADFNACLALFDEWKNESGSTDNTERIAIARVLSSLTECGARCGLLYVDGRLIAMGVTSISTRGVGQVHFEKALNGYDGAYAAINNLCATAYLSDTTLINRQEDMGIEGLRTAKLSYHPQEIIVKYKFLE